MNRSPRSPEGYPQPAYPWLGLAAAPAAPLLLLVIEWESGLFWAITIPVGIAQPIPLGFVLLAVAAFPLMMPADVRYLAALVSMALMTVLALLLFPLYSGLLLIPVLASLFFVWVTNHPRIMRCTEKPGKAESAQDTAEKQRDE
ncbi:hypothetical protein NE857_09530 [Nocardiopsis exhalans]|uniref:Uncharacterized protein n=1 Tax=Nocardiopsis exhalans TaxID=163604 RepID=A0ABY5DFD8_9ACTN|nr:hypothetical protein [Nocardiopsis exhalans]USY21821.1 hypothetical protein NE857_09530 [Nocardiopsis exhalans]